MSWLFSQALVAEFSAVTCSAGEPSAQLNGTPTPQAFSFSDKTTAYSRLSRFGMTCKPLRVDHGEALLTWYLAASHARIFHPKESAQESTERNPACGDTWRGSLARFDPDTHSLRTVQSSLLPDLGESYVILPDWGSMRTGAVYQLPPPALPIYETESGLLPTPRVSRGYTNPTLGKRRNDCLTTEILGEPILGMRPNPRYVEWMMGFPIGWTALRGSETPKFREWQQQHSAS